MTGARSGSSVPSVWRRWLWQIALSAAEILIALGLGGAVFAAAHSLGCRVIAPACDGAGGLAVVVVGVVASLFVASAYWTGALALGAAGRHRARYWLSGIVAAVAIGNLVALEWRQHRSQAAYRAETTAAAQKEAADREAWIAALRQNPEGHGAPGIVPPMLRVADAGIGVEVTNLASEWLVVALARVRPVDGQMGWQACPLLTVGEISGHYRFAIGPGQSARYAPLPSCGAEFEGAPLEFRVGDPLPGAMGWWSDSAFEAPRGRLP